MATDKTGPTDDEQVTDATEPHVIEDEAAFERVIQTEELVLADFYADWCAPCVVVGDFVETVAEETLVTVLKIDVEVHQKLAGRFNVRSLPTLVLFQDGDSVERLVGLQDEADIVRLVERFAD